jgi:hypothetical protein
MKLLFKNVLSLWLTRSSILRSKVLAAFGLMLGLAVLPSTVSGQTTYCDNFNDGNDTVPLPPWTHYQPLLPFGAGGTWSLSDGAYRIQAAASPDPGNLGPGRAGSIRSENYTNFYVSVDVVSWDDTIRQFCGVGARLGTVGLGTTTGYLFGHDRGDPSSETAGDMDIVRLDGESPTDLDPSGVMDGVHLVPGKSYRFVLIGVGDQLTGKVYELPDTANPIVNYTTTDGTYPSGVSGIIVADNSSGGGGTADMTFDNFLSTTAEPVLSAQMSSSGAVTLTWPNVPYTLQGTPSLSPPITWTDITSGISQMGDQNVYSIASPSGNQFFRLTRSCP